MAFILDDILLAPCNLVTWIGRTLYDQAEAELTDELAIHEQLLALQTQLELGKLTEEKYIQQEDVLMRRLNEIQKYKDSRHEAQQQR